MINLKDKRQRLHDRIERIQERHDIIIRGLYDVLRDIDRDIDREKELSSCEVIFKGLTRAELEKSVKLYNAINKLK